MGKHLSLWGKIKAYRLKNNVVVMIALLVVFGLALVIYVQPFCHNNAVLSNIALACFTSLLATVVGMCAEIYVKYKTYENDQFLEDIHTFGIANLNKDKENILRELLAECDSIIWISGYRLILTDHIKSDIAQAIRRGASVKALICPPWSMGFQMVYGGDEKVMDHYFNVFHAISEAKSNDSGYEVLFVDKPLFSDTYRVDQNLVTGPYMHNRDPEYNRIMAKDFFSYNLVKKSRLYSIVEGEYLTLCDEAVMRLDWAKFDEAYVKLQHSDLRECEKTELLRQACEPYTSSK